jgi:hypothetical protein
MFLLALKCVLELPRKRLLCGYVECGAKQSATPLCYWATELDEPKRRRRSALPAHSIGRQ